MENPALLLDIEYPPRGGAWTLDEAFAYCARSTSSHYENFPVASLFLPADRRPYIQAVYAFSRTADDFADELDRTPDERIRLLDSWEQMLGECYDGSVHHPVFIALQETIRRYDLQRELLVDLLNAFKRDVTQNRYATFADLESYCKCSANPVGRIVLAIFGYRDEKLLRLSDTMCTALQLANFWQDISVDRRKDRLYIPLEDMARFGYDVDAWRLAREDQSASELIHFQVERTKDLFYACSALPDLVDRDLHIELKLVWLGGMQILREIEKSGFRTMNLRPTLGTMAKLLLLGRALVITDLSTYRKRKPWWDLTR